jgi:hypothetical protein
MCGERPPVLCINEHHVSGARHHEDAAPEHHAHDHASEPDRDNHRDHDPPAHRPHSSMTGRSKWPAVSGSLQRPPES